MKAIQIAVTALGFLFFVSCVSKGKFNALEAAQKSTRSELRGCTDQLAELQKKNEVLEEQKKTLLDQVDYLKANSTQVLSTLQDLSVLSQKQAESVKRSLENLSQKDAYIQDLQTAMSRKDSLTMVLVMNIKGAIGDISDSDINVQVEKGVVYISISDKLLFQSGRYQVNESAKKVLGKVAKVLNAHPELEFMVEGHTDTVPIHTACIDDNWDLSVKRATSVVKILVNDYRLDPKKIAAAGHGEFLPLVSNESEKGRALNRRTRIVILPQLDQFFKLLEK